MGEVNEVKLGPKELIGNGSLKVHPRPRIDLRIVHVYAYFRITRDLGIDVVEPPKSVR